MNEYYRNYLEQHRKERSNITLRSKSLIKPSSDKFKDFTITNNRFNNKQTIYPNNNEKVLLNTKTLYASASKQNKWKSNFLGQNIFKSSDAFGKNSKLFNQSPSIPLINTNKISFNQIDWSLLLQPESERVIKTKGQNQLIYERLSIKKEKEFYSTKTKSFKESSYPQELFDRNKDSANNTITNLFSTNYNKFNRRTIKLEDYLRKTQFTSSSSRVDNAPDFKSELNIKIESKESKETAKEDECKSDISVKVSELPNDNKIDIDNDNDLINININKENEVININIDNNSYKNSNDPNNEIKSKLDESESPKEDEKKKDRKTSNTNIDNIFKRLMEKTQKEAEARNNNSFLNSTQFQQKIYNKKATSTKFFNATNSNFTKSESATPAFNHKGNIEFTIDKNEIYHWYKHEEIWNNLSYLSNIDNIKYLSPPNERDILLFSYYHKFNCKDNKIIIASDTSPDEEIKKWKTVYKKLMIRWHPDKLFNILEKLPIEDELINKIKKKTCSIINYLGSLFNSIIEKVKTIK